MNRKILFSNFILFFLILAFFPQRVFAEDKLLGEECSNFTCASGDCEEANNDKKYCTCDEASDCSEQYQPLQEGEVWSCKGPDDNNLHYCESTIAGRTAHYGPGATKAVGPGGASRPSIWNNLNLNDDEIKRITSKPQTKITLPGLNFSEAKVIETPTEGAFISIPFLGEYLGAAYRYGIAAAGILAVIILVNAGFLWTRSGGNAQTITAQKESIEKAVIGLIIAVSSFTLLYFINPNLTKFPHLKVQYIKPDTNLAGDHPEGGIDGEPNIDITAAGALADCTSYPKTRKGIEQCRKDCLAKLPEEKRSKASGIADNISYLGYIDCSSIKGERNLKDVRYIGIHEGKAAGGLSWWWTQYVEKGPAKAFGTHYFIGRDGTIYQAADEKFVVWHGVKNKSAMGIDLDGECSSGSGSDKVSKTCNYTEAQYTAVKKLITDIQERTSVVFDDDHILGHCQMSNNPKEGHMDPRNFDWTKIGLSNEEHKGTKGVRCLYAR